MELEKIFIFEDGSFAKFILGHEEKSLSFVIQAKVLGKEIKTTSTSLSLTKEETLELIDWLKITYDI
jgi:hypothetical protein